MRGRGSFNVALFDMEISDLQATVTAGSCSSRVIFNVPKARSRGIEVEFAAAPNEHFDFSLSGSFNNSELRSTLDSPTARGRDGHPGREPPAHRARGPGGGRGHLPVAGPPGLARLHDGQLSAQGSRFTQIGDQANGFGTVNLLSFAPNTIGGPLRASTFTFNPELPAYDIVNLRVGLNRGRWDLALYGSNLTDERALLSLDQERGTRARVGYLTNQPRTFGINGALQHALRLLRPPPARAAR